MLAIGDFKGEPDRAKLYKDIKIIINKYGSLDMGQVDVAEFIQELLEVMKNNRIVMPHGFTMLARGITQIEGVLADIAPGINMVGIASARIKQEMLKNQLIAWWSCRKEWRRYSRNIIEGRHA